MMRRLTHGLVFGVIVAMMVAPAGFAGETEVPTDHKDGLLNSLFGEDSSLGSLLGEDGSLSSLLGEDGSLSSLLGEGGSLSSLLGEGGSLSSLFGEDGSLSTLLGDSETLEDLVGKAKESLSDSGVADALEGILSKDGSFDLSSLEGAASNLLGSILGEGDASDLLGSIFGGGDDGFGALDELFAMVDSINSAENEYLKEHNAAHMDEGDVQIVTNCNIWSPDDMDLDEYKNLTLMDQGNYKLDEENQLLFVSGARDVVLYTLTRDAEGNYTVADARFAEDGENYMPSIEAFCEEVGEPVEECMETIEFSDYMVLIEMKKYLDENPEITGIEYDGAVRTAEELEEMESALLDEMYGGMETEAE